MLKALMELAIVKYIRTKWIRRVDVAELSFVGTVYPRVDGPFFTNFTYEVTAHGRLAFR